ncbi:hypothetical protein [Kiloniella antarctica]|uniref:Peptidase S74 domain-containing protein n=1 Tax=Kiloniella antarctica TaxID=1550907 RepID=A0ABW5BNZ4_9PROT
MFGNDIPGQPGLLDDYYKSNPLAKMFTPGAASPVDKIKQQQMTNTLLTIGGALSAAGAKSYDPGNSGKAMAGLGQNLQGVQNSAFDQVQGLQSQQDREEAFGWQKAKYDEDMAHKRKVFGWDMDKYTKDAALKEEERKRAVLESDRNYGLAADKFGYQQGQDAAKTDLEYAKLEAEANGLNQTFAGNSLPAQMQNILLHGDPSSPQYAAAYNDVGSPKTHFDPQTGSMYSVTPNMSAYKKPTFNQASQQTQQVSTNPQQQYGGSGGVDVAQAAAPENIKITGESAGKVGLALDAVGILDDDFIKKVENGAVTGLWDQGFGVMLGRDEAGSMAREIRSGSEAIVRMLTGAGKSESEATQEVMQYLPGVTDDAETAANKLRQMRRRLETILTVATKGISQDQVNFGPRADAGAPQVTTDTGDGSVDLKKMSTSELIQLIP